MLKYILLAVVVTANIMVSLYFMNAGSRELYKPLKHQFYFTAILSALTALSTFIAALL